MLGDSGDKGFYVILFGYITPSYALLMVARGKPDCQHIKSNSKLVAASNNSKIISIVNMSVPFPTLG